MPKNCVFCIATTRDQADQIETWLRAAGFPREAIIRHSSAIESIAEALALIGIPEFDIRRYENEVHGGKVLIAVDTEAAGEIATARKVFVQAGVEDMGITPAPPMRFSTPRHVQ